MMIQGTLQLVVSGGQTGADQAGLVAARTAGLRTAGWAPRGWRTLDGPAPWLGERYGLLEHHSSHYKERTWANVHWADATIRVVKDPFTPGERCTMNAISRYGKPWYDLHFETENLAGAIQFILSGQYESLNIAGNSEQTCPGMYLWAKRTLTRTFRLVKEQQYVEMPPRKQLFRGVA